MAGPLRLQKKSFILNGLALYTPPPHNGPAINPLLMARPLREELFFAASLMQNLTYIMHEYPFVH